MDKLQKHIIKSLSSLFFAMFMPLFAIASVIFLIKLATYTAVIQLSVGEMAKLYLFVLPEIFFYTLPITFFIATTLTLFRISNDNEMIVIFSLGIKPFFLFKALVKPALLLMVLLVIDFFVIFPHTKILYANFIIYKKSEAKFNLSASEFGNSFGDWLLYLGKENADGTFSKVFLFNKDTKEEVLIAAKKAALVNDSGILRLKLYKGEGYSYSKESFNQINFETMMINDTMKTDLYTYKKPLEYWLSDDEATYKRRRLTMYSLISLFPVVSLFMSLAIGIVHAREQKSKIYFFLFLSIMIYYGATLGLKDKLGFYNIPFVAIVWTLLTYIFYRRTIVKRF